MNKQYNLKSEQQKITEVMSWILELKKDEELIVLEMIERLGVKTFFLNVESLDLSSAVKEKLITLKNILEAFDGEIASIEFLEDGGEE